MFGLCPDSSKKIFDLSFSVCTLPALIDLATDRKAPKERRKIGAKSKAELFFIRSVEAH